MEAFLNDFEKHSKARQQVQKLIHPEELWIQTRTRVVNGPEDDAKKAHDRHVSEKERIVRKKPALEEPE
jgi:hypothetical protein